MGDTDRSATNRLIREDGFDLQRVLHYEGLFTLGSGLLHLRGSLSEPLTVAPQDQEYLRLPTNVTAERHPKRFSVWGTYVPPVVGRHPLLNTVIVNLPSPLPVEVRISGEVLSVESDRLRAHQRFLDPRRAVLERYSQWELSNGITANLTERRFVSRVRPNLLIQEFVVDADRRCGGTVIYGVDGRVRTNGHDHFIRSEVVRPMGTAVGVAIETDLGHPALVMSIMEAVSGDDGESVVHSEDDRSVFNELPVRVSPGSPARLLKYSVVCELPTAAAPGEAMESFDGERLSKPVQWLHGALAAGAGTLFAEHEEAWSRLWAGADVTVEGPPDERPGAPSGGTTNGVSLSAEEIDRSLHFSIYHLLRAHRTGETRYAVCPKGHAGEAYFGRYFWDTEIHLLPFYIYTDPVHARDLLRFRVNTLAGARRNAARYGNAGARFAWESSISGDEECPNWQYADHEIHVTADVVYGIFHYVRATGDDAFIAEEAAELLIEAARFYQSRMDQLPDGSVHLLGVMGPDEYSPFSRDNAFTNRLARFALTMGADLLERSGSGSVEEARTFRSLAEQLPVPFDRERGIVLQSQDFEDYPPLDPKRCDPNQPIGMQAPQELLYRRKALKQADVVALIALFPRDFPMEVRERSFDYYEALTTHDSSLSATTHALVAAMLGREGAALSFLSRSINIDIGEEVGDASQGIHMANAGGHWQVIVHGFLGVRPASVEGSSVLSVNPLLPRAIGRISSVIHWRGTAVRVTAAREEVSAEHLSGPAVAVELAGEACELVPGARRSVRRNAR